MNRERETVRRPNGLRPACRVLAAATLTVAAAASIDGGSRAPARAIAASPGRTRQQAPQAPAPGASAWLARTNKPEFVTLSDRALGVVIEYPKKDWQIIPGGLTTVVTFRQKKGESAVIVERTKMMQPLKPEEITEVFGQIEAEVIKERLPQASGFATQMLGAAERRVIGIQYQRSGPTGPEVVRQYSFPLGQTLYRISCVIRPDKIREYVPVCAHMAASFRASATP